MNTHKSKIYMQLNYYKHTKNTNLPQPIYPLGQLGIALARNISN